MRQKNTTPPSICVTDKFWTRTLRWEEEPVLMLTLRYPRLPEHSPGLRRVGRYYQQLAEQWRARWEGTLLRQASAAASAAREESRPFRMWEATLTYNVTRQSDGLLSLYTDAYEYTGGNHGLTIRQGDVWELPSGTPRSLRSFFPVKHRWKRLVLDQITTQVQARVDTGDYQFYDDWPQKLSLFFDPERFYCTDTELIVFYPAYSIAPRMERIPTFSILLGQDDQRSADMPTIDGQSAEIDHKNPLKR